MQQSSSQRAIRCTCGAVTFEATAPPLFGIVCHCTLCQRFTGRDFADLLVYRTRDLRGLADAPIEYVKLRPPPNVPRGKCSACGTPMIDVLTLPLVGSWSMIPREAHAATEDLPGPVGHMFYHRRVRDCDDDLPKYEAYWPSELAFMTALFRAGRT